MDESCMLPAVSAQLQAVLGHLQSSRTRKERTCCIEERDADAANGLVGNAVQLLQNISLHLNVHPAVRALCAACSQWLAPGLAPAVFK